MNSNINLLSELKSIYGDNAEFRPLQKKIIESVLSGSNTLAVLGTGSGKSLTYFLPTKILRANGCDPTIVISPTISLMNDQIHSFGKFGTAVTLNSSPDCCKADVYNLIQNNQADIIFVSPETALSNEFITTMNSAYTVPLVVIDEAHSVSLYSSDFRPAYSRLCEVIRRLNGSPTILGTTATASNRVVTDLETQFSEITTFRGSLDRPNFIIEAYEMFNDAEKKKWLKANLLNMKKLYGKGVIYCASKDYIDNVAAFIREDIGLNAIEFTSVTANNIQRAIDFRDGYIDCLVATEAFGMGIDIPDIGYILQYQPPLSIESYFQQIGRGGRDIEKVPVMKAITFYCETDKKTIDSILKNSCPPLSTTSKILSQISELSQCTPPEILSILNTREKQPDRFQRTLNFLIANKYINVHNSSLCLGSKTLDTYDEIRDLNIKQKNLEYQKLFDILFTNNECIMQQIRIALNDPTLNIKPCGKCSVCRGNNP